MKFIKLLAIASMIALGMARADAQSAPKKYISTASTNCNLVRAGNSVLHDLIPINTTTTIYYLKLYNKATAPVAGTDIPLWTIPLPFGATSSGGGVDHHSAPGILFPDGFGFCITGAVADADSSNAATGLVINIGVSPN